MLCKKREAENDVPFAEIMGERMDVFDPDTE